MKEYYIVADCGGGAGPFESFDVAREDILPDETGVEIWEISAGQDLDDAVTDGTARLLWSRWPS